MKKQNYLLLFTLLTSLIIFSQETEYIIVEELKNKTDSNVYKIKEITIKTQKYENREVDNPKYLRFETKIDSLNKEIETLKGVKLSGSQRQHLVNAKHYLKKGVEFKNSGASSFLGEKWTDIKYAKKELDKSDLEFQQTTTKKYLLAIEEAKKNILKIDNLLGRSSKKLKMIDKLNNEISELKRIINSPFRPIKKKIIKDVPIGEIERNILIVDTVNIYSKITGKFININGSQYYLMKQDFKEFVKNELVLSNIISDKVEDDIGSLKNLNRLTSDKVFIIKNTENRKLYFTNEYILNKIGLNENEYKLSEILKSNNIKIVKETHPHWKNRKITYVIKSNSKCVYTEYIKQELLNGNTNIIQQTVSEVKQYNIYYKQSLKALETVTKDRQSYKYGTMKASRLTKWKSDINKLISIDKKMDDIHYGKYRNDRTSDLAYQYHRSFSKQLAREQVQISSTISDMIRECKILTGI
jgi:hypothetical protein